ncbi:MAG: hypothetical protein GXP14_03175 [Gammaproteobacteria bacterium]|nr:hypothetical protein [Gammaproteobacteria bacterium]
MKEIQNLKYFFSAILILILITSCGGGGSLPESRPATSVEGVAFDAAIVNGLVTVYDYSTGNKGTKFNSGSTDEFGNFSVDLAIANQPLLLEIKGGQYEEEASGTLVALNSEQKLSTVINYNANASKQVTISYYTHLATGLAEFLINTGVEVTTAIEQANRSVSRMTGVSITDTIPQNITLGTASDTELTNSYRYGFLTAAISEWTKWVSEQNAEDVVHTLYNSIQFAQLTYEDIRIDGRLDGLGADGALLMGVVPVRAEHYTNEIPQRLLRLANSDLNKSALTAEDLLVVASNYNSALLDLNLFANAPEIPRLNLSPVIGTLSLADVETVSGIIEQFGATVTDQAGIAKIDITVDDAVHTSISDFSNPFVNIDSTTLEDGLHEFGLIATNVIGLTSSISKKIIIDNTPPVVSDIWPLSGQAFNSDFEVTAKISDAQGIAKIEINFSEKYIKNPTLQETGRITQPFVVSAMEDGAYTLNVLATDFAGNLGSANEATVYIDQTRPELIIADTYEAYSEGCIATINSATDATSEFSVKVEIETQIKEVNWEAPVNMVMGSGDSNVSFIARDRAGNEHRVDRCIRKTVDANGASCNPAPNDACGL